MKKNIFLFTVLVFSGNVLAQMSYVNSLKQKLKTTKADSTKFNVLMELTQYYQDSKQDSLLFYAKEQLIMGEGINNTEMIGLAYGNIGVHEYIAGNYPVALQMLFKSLQLAESINDSSLIEYSCEKIGNTYKEYDAPDKAKQYYLQIKTIGERMHNDKFTQFAYGNLGYVYCVMNMLDSAMYYEQQEYTTDIKTRSDQIGWTLLSLGNIQLKLHNRSLALNYYKSAIDSTKKLQGDCRILTKCYLGLAGFYRTYGVNDSAIYYAHLSLNVSKKLPYLKGISNAARFLSDIYDSVHGIDSAFYYQRIFISTNDTLNSRNRNSSVANLTFLEQTRLQEREQTLKKTREERKQNIEYALMALGIITFIILFLLLIRSVIIHEKLIEILGVIALLIVFEFLNLLLHPFLGRVTDENPLLMLLALVCMAALLVPMHHRLEKWATHRLVENNKQIKLAAAKKTIEKLKRNKTEA
jgi:hypothetical protein